MDSDCERQNPYSECQLTMIPFLMVSATRAPTATAPTNSKTAAPSMACLIVRERDEMEVAQALATSFAPML